MKNSRTELITSVYDINIQSQPLLNIKDSNKVLNLEVDVFSFMASVMVEK